MQQTFVESPPEAAHAGPAGSGRPGWPALAVLWLLALGQAGLLACGPAEVAPAPQATLRLDRGSGQTSAIPAESPTALAARWIGELDPGSLPPELEIALAEDLRTLEVGPDSAGALLHLAERLDAHALHSAAAKAYRAAAYMGATSGKPEVWRARALALEAFSLAEIGALEQALASLDQAIALAPGRAPLHWRRGLWLAELDAEPEARQAFETALRLAPGEPSATLGLARLDLDQGAVQAARERLEAQLAANPTEAPARALLARVLREAGEPELAEQERRLARGALPSWRDPWQVEAEAKAVGYGAVMGAALDALRGGRPGATLDEVLALHHSAPDDITVQGMLTGSWIALGRAPEAVAMLQAAAERQPNHFRVAMNLALALDAAKRPEEALDAALRAVQLHPAFADAHRLVAKLESKQEQHAAAIASYRRALELEPEDPRALEGLAMALRRAQLPAEARVEFLRLADLTPGRARPLAFAALCLAEVGDLVGAQAEFARAQALEPRDAAVEFVARKLAEAQSRSSR